MRPGLRRRLLAVFAGLACLLVASLSLAAPKGDKGDKAAAEKAAAAEEDDDSNLAATIKLIQEALKAQEEGRYADCVAKDKEALKLDDSPRTRIHLSRCEAQMGNLVDALKDAEKALAAGLQKRDAPVTRSAYAQVKELIDRTPHVTFLPPSNVEDLRVTFDDRPVPVDSLTKKFLVNPGKHRVTAEGTLNNFKAIYDEDIEVPEKETILIRITLKPKSNDYITPGQIACMKAANSPEEVLKCLPQNQKNLIVRIAGDLAGYTDTLSVNVYTPAMNASLVSPTAGWNVGGNFLVDAVSAASPDLVASASPPFAEYRYAGGLTGGYKPGLYGGQGIFNVSSSPDYVSYTGGLRFTADLNDKLITPTFGYTYSYDRIGRGPNNWLKDFNPDYKGFLNTHEFEGGVTFVVSPTMIALVGGTLSLERGDQSQPYRYIPTFDKELVAPFIPPGAAVALVNETRLPAKPLEQLPTERNRVAIGGRLNKRFTNATLRLEERLYIDTWGMKASSTDGRYMVDLSRRLRVWPHGRLHFQTDTNFYRLAYTSEVPVDGTGQLILPLYRTGDRELSPLVTLTGGGGVRFALGEPEGSVRYALTFVADVMYTRFLSALYVKGRTAMYGSIGFDVEF